MSRMGGSFIFHLQIYFLNKSSKCAKLFFSCISFFQSLATCSTLTLFSGLITNGQFENGVQCPQGHFLVKLKTHKDERRSCQSMPGNGEMREHNKFPRCDSAPPGERREVWRQREAGRRTCISSISPLAFVSQTSTKRQWIIAVSWCWWYREKPWAVTECRPFIFYQRQYFFTPSLTQICCLDFEDNIFKTSRPSLLRGVVFFTMSFAGRLRNHHTVILH